MLYIKKRPCPPDIQHRLDTIMARGDYKELPEVNCGGKGNNEKLRKMFNSLQKEGKHRIREALLEEQAGLCAYCMSKIYNDGNVTTIEHFLPLSKYKSKALDYSNYMAVCNGGRNAKPGKGRKKVQCCDASKGNIVSELNPHKKETIEGLIYDERGWILPNYGSAEKDERIRKEIDEIFVLNGKIIDKKRVDTSTNLVKRRKDVYEIYDTELSEMRENGELTVEFLDEKIREIEDVTATSKKEFAGVMLFLYKLYRDQLT